MDLRRDAYPTRTAEVRPGVVLTYAHAGAGGVPLLLVHGWPETRRIWWRNIGPLADSGFEVIAPDLRGFGDSNLPADGRYDLAAHSRDLAALVHDTLGHQRCVAAASDLGGAILIDLGLRQPGLLAAQCLFNCPLPALGDAYAAAGLPTRPTVALRQAADYYRRQGRDADGLAAELDTPARRRRYVGEFYGHRFWAAPGAFTPEAVDFHTEPFGDGDRLRASFANYEAAMGGRSLPEPPRFFEPIHVPTLALYGPEDHVIQREWPRMVEVACTDVIGPFVVEGAGHFLQWERASVLNGALRGFLLHALGSVPRSGDSASEPGRPWRSAERRGSPRASEPPTPATQPPASAEQTPTSAARAPATAQTPTGVDATTTTASRGGTR